MLCSAAVLQSLRQRAHWKISYIIGFSSDRLARSSMINIFTDPENEQGWGSLRQHYSTLPPSENPIKLGNYPYPVQGGCLCTSGAIFFLSMVASHKAVLSISLPIGPLSLTAFPPRLGELSWLTNRREWCAPGRVADEHLAVNYS